MDYLGVLLHLEFWSIFVMDHYYQHFQLFPCSLQDLLEEQVCMYMYDQYNNVIISRCYCHAVFLVLEHYLAFQYFAMVWHPFQEVNLSGIPNNNYF